MRSAPWGALAQVDGGVTTITVNGVQGGGKRNVEGEEDKEWDRRDSRLHRE